MALNEPIRMLPPSFVNIQYWLISTENKGIDRIAIPDFYDDY